MMRLARTLALWTLLLGPGNADATMKYHASDVDEATMNSARYAFQNGEAWWLQRLSFCYCVFIDWIGILHIQGSSELFNT